MILVNNLGIYQQGGVLSQVWFIEEQVLLVKKIVLYLMVWLLVLVQLEDLMQVGMIGLFEVVQCYIFVKGVIFEIYVGICIWGVMVDEICKGDWVFCFVYCNVC